MGETTSGAVDPCDEGTRERISKEFLEMNEPKDLTPYERERLRCCQSQLEMLWQMHVDNHGRNLALEEFHGMATKYVVPSLFVIAMSLALLAGFYVFDYLKNPLLHGG
jgi:hypothetical protein